VKILGSVSMGFFKPVAFIVIEFLLNIYLWRGSLFWGHDSRENRYEKMVKLDDYFFGVFFL
jgi:hypothetical protein